MSWRRVGGIFQKVRFASSASNKVSSLNNKRSSDLMVLFPEIQKDLTEEELIGLPEVSENLSKVLHYNVLPSRLQWARITTFIYNLLEDPTDLTSENLKKANILGWCMELFQASVLMADDILDRAETRWGLPCWYKKEGMRAVNDCYFVENSIYAILKKHLSEHPNYIPIVELFHEAVLGTAMGQTLDLQLMKHLDKFTMVNYRTLAKYKTQYCSQLPTASVMYLTKKYSPETIEQAKLIMHEIGLFYQVEDDFLDCFLDTSITGKNGRDIPEGKCNWLVVRALQMASQSQRKILEENYGRSEAEAVEAVRKLYEDLELPKVYAMYKKDCYKSINSFIQRSAKSLPTDMFLIFLDRLHEEKVTW